MIDTNLDRVGLKRTSVQGAAISLGSQMGKFGAQFLYQILLARMLSPNDFGLVAMAVPIIAFGHLFVDLGLSQATIQRPQITQDQLSLLFWINVAGGVLLGLITIAASPFVGVFYGEARVVAITAILGAMFLMSGLSSQHLALLNRDLSFGKLAIVDMGAFLAGSAAGLLAAFEGLGYRSLLVAAGVNSLTTLILAWSLSGWRPGRPERVEGWKDIIGFGGNLTGFSVVNYFARNLDNVLIGRFNGGDALGLYDRAYTLMLTPLSQISQPFSRVALPLLARTQCEPEVYRRAYVGMLEIILLLTYPGALFAIVTRDQLIGVVLGEQWASVAPIFGILGVGALFAPISSSTGWLFVSQDRTRQMRNWGVFSSTLFVLSFIVGLPWGPVGVATCYIGVGMVQGPVLWWAATREGPVGFRHVLGALLPHAFAGVICSAALLALQHNLPTGFLSLALLMAAGYSTFVGTLLIMPGGRGILKAVWEYGKLTVTRFGVLH